MKRSKVALDNSPVAQPASMQFGHQTKLKEL